MPQNHNQIKLAACFKNILKNNSLQVLSLAMPKETCFEVWGVGNQLVT